MLPAIAEQQPFPFQATFPSRAGAASDSLGAARRRNNWHHDDDTAVHSEEPSVDVAFELPWSDLREIAGNQNRKALTSRKELTPKLSSSQKKVHT